VQTTPQGSASLMEDLDERYLRLLDHLETERSNTHGPATSVSPLSAPCSPTPPGHPNTLRPSNGPAIPPKLRQENCHLPHREESTALIAAPTSALEGRRDRALLAVAILTGLRVSELIGLDCDTSLRCRVTSSAKGKPKQRPFHSLPQPASLRVWTAERAGRPSDPLFPTKPEPLTETPSNGESPPTPPPCTRCPSLRNKHLSVHTFDTAAPCRSSKPGSMLRHRPVARPLRHPIHDATSRRHDHQTASPRTGHTPTSSRRYTPRHHLAFLESCNYADRIGDASRTSPPGQAPQAATGGLSA